MPITYHLATEADIHILAEFRIRFLVDFFGEQPKDAEDELRKNLEIYYAKVTREKTHLSWFAKDGDRVVSIGGMILRELPPSFKISNGKMGHIINMYTVPEYRRKGISHTVLNHIIESGKAEGIKIFELNATKAGQALYEKNGFRVHSEPYYRLLIP